MRSLLTNTLFAVASAVVASGIVAFADPALANVGDTAPQKVAVQTSDLNLHTDAGRDVARRRIRAAADRVCIDYDAARFPTFQCREKAITAAEHALDAKFASTVPVAEFANR